MQNYGDLVCHHTLKDQTVATSPQSDADDLIYHVTFMGRLRVWGERDVVELAQAKPLAVDRHAKVAEINGLPGSLGDLVGCGSRGFALRRQIRHDDSADVQQKQHQRGGGKKSQGLLFQQKITN